MWARTYRCPDSMAAASWPRSAEAGSELSCESAVRSPNGQMCCSFLRMGLVAANYPEFQLRDPWPFPTAPTLHADARIHDARVVQRQRRRL
jgi:hypothetical protein